MEIHHILEQINCWCRFSVGSSFWLAIWERTAHAASTYSRRLDHANCSDNHENQQSWWNQGHPEDHFRLCSFVVYFHYWRWHVSSLSDPCSENKNFGILDALELQKCRKEERKTTLILPPAWIMVLLHFQVSLYVTLKWAWCGLEDPQQPQPPFKGEHLERARTSGPVPISSKGKAPWCPHGWLKISAFNPIPPLWLGIGGRGPLGIKF